MPPPEGRGKTFSSKKGKVAPDALKEALAPVKQDVKPTAVVAKEMFAVAKAAKAAPKAPAPKAPVAKAPVAKVSVAKAAEAPAKAEPAEAVAKAEPAPAASEEDLTSILEAQEAPATIQSDLDRLPAEQKEMAILIQKEEKRDLYDTQIPAAYVPQTRRGFSDFIKLQYKPFILPAGPIQVPEGEKYYPYQKFVRDYMRQEAPYRGVIVYHGLGSGKTCTAIAAAEALFATAKKNIIVMSPFSLKKNFLREVSKCGFRHFQLKNFWVALPNPRDDPTVTFFANSVLGLSARYLKKARNVWVPDFRKTQAESNYETLPPEDREEIRKQILSVVEYDPETNPTGRIRFISYNGISAKKLMRMACDPSPNKFFDNSVIVVDEIHNLIRTIHGNIEPYLVKTKEGVSKGVRKIEVEEVGPDRWVPNRLMCDEGRTGDFYKRGYLFYRLLLDARNSKIIGLSGTPLINYPEELGILSNVLHGYINIVDGVIEQTGADIQKKAKEIGLAHPFVDYVGTKSEAAGTRVIMSLLPAGNRKIDNDVGIARIPPFQETDLYVSIYSTISDLFEKPAPPAMEETVGAVRGAYETSVFPPFDAIQRAIMGVYSKGGAAVNKKSLMDAIAAVYSTSHDMPVIVQSIHEAFKAAGLPMSQPPKVRSEPLLPPFGDDFKQAFVPNGTSLINKATLLTRLTGLVSFYKGSSLELMPRVARDEVVRVPFSDYAQKAYSFKRNIELKKEMEANPGQTVDAVWAQIYELGDSGSANNYKMGSRQACNFAFPPEVLRPTASNKKEVNEEAAAGIIPDELVALAPDADAADDAVKDAEEFPELEAEEEGARAEAAAAIKDEGDDLEEQGGGGKTAAEKEAERRQREARELVERIRKENAEGLEDMPPLEHDSGDEAPPAEAPPTAAPPPPAPAPAPAPPPAAPKPKGVFKSKAAVAAEAAECKAGKKPGEKYSVACQRAKACLSTIAKARMILGGPDGLANYSGKFAAMLERIRDAPGSSLIYSQFLDMEGVGIFRVAMDVNGYAPIEVVITGGTLSFTKATEVSLRLGPGKQPRYMTFSGGEKPEQRAAALSIFNAQFSDLPQSMNKILKEAGYTDNKVGELCRVFCITSAGAEGLSLRNVRAVHIMEPYWNEVRLKQVKGRAIRIGSHLDLPVDQRDVSIYTYISVFSDEAQSNKVPDKRIDQTLLLHDSVDAAVATEAGIPIKPGATTYVLTTDEMIYTISERKRKIIEALECVMKSSSVDCEVNLKKNKDGSFMCLPLKGKIGSFLYNPVLADDLLDAPQFVGPDGKDILGNVCVPGAPPVELVADPAANDLFKKLGEVTYRLRPVMNEEGVTERFDLYEADQKRPMKKIPLKLLGTAGVKDGKPAPPIKMLEKS